MLVRCGIGKLILYDYDIVELANMNRLFYRPNQVGLDKTVAAKETLEVINNDVEIIGRNVDVTRVEMFDGFLRDLRCGGLEGGGVDMVLCCVDNYVARGAVNVACNELGVRWLESGVSEDAMGGHVQLMVPGRTACYSCVPPLIVARGVDEKTLKRDGVCAASLPTTMAVVAGMLVQSCLKLLLAFGEVSDFLGYSAMVDYFPKMALKPNVNCSDSWCRKRQEEYKEQKRNEENTKIGHDKDDDDRDKKDLHPTNDWGIEVEEVEDSQDSSSNGTWKPGMGDGKEQDRKEVENGQASQTHQHDVLGSESKETTTTKSEATTYVTSDPDSVESLIAELSSLR